jgi:hypothetical protein
MRTLVAAKEAVQEARRAVLEAVHVHGWIYGLDDADSLLDDAISQIDGEIARRRDGIPSDPLALQVAP